MGSVLGQFNDLFRRSFGPSTTFIVLWAVSYYYYAKLTGTGTELGQELKSWLEKGAGAAIPVMVITFGMIGLSYLLSALNSIIFDHGLRENFNHDNTKNKRLAELREAVVARMEGIHSLEPVLPREEAQRTDYQLYEIIRAALKTRTLSYVDRAKSTGIAAISIMVLLLGYALHAWNCFSLLLLSLGVLTYLLGKEAVMANYRTRAIRLYTEFMTAPLAKLRKKMLE